LIFENKAVVGYHHGHAMETDPELIQSGSADLSNLLFGEEIEITIDTTFPLSEVQGAHEYIEDRQNKRKVILKP